VPPIILFMRDAQNDFSLTMGVVFSGGRLSVVDYPARGSIITFMADVLVMSSALPQNIFLERV
jgi:hypothetical protein